MNPRVTSFPALIRWIANKYHNGKVLPIAGRVGVSPALVNLWVKGDTKEPKPRNLQRLCAAYNLDFMWVLGLLTEERVTPIRGGSGAEAALTPLNIIPATDKNLIVSSTLPPVGYQTHPTGRRQVTVWVEQPLLPLPLAA